MNLNELRQAIDKLDGDFIAKVAELMHWLKKNHQSAPNSPAQEKNLLRRCLDQVRPLSKNLDSYFVIALITCLRQYASRHGSSLGQAGLEPSESSQLCVEILTILNERVELARQVESVKRENNEGIINVVREETVIETCISHGHLVAGEETNFELLEEDFVILLMTLVIDYCTKVELSVREASLKKT